MTTVLVVDDLVIDRKLAGGLLEKGTNWQVLYASNGKDALEQIELHLPDIVLTDLQMPEMNGLELVEQMKREYPLTPVILMTAKGSEEIAVAALNRGASSYVPKRELAQELVQTVESVLSVARVGQSQSRLMNRLKSCVETFVLENDLALISALIGHMQQGVVGMRICEEADWLRVGVALEEALVNAFYHGNLEVSSELRETDHDAYHNLARERAAILPYSERKIRVRMKLTRSKAVFIIRDDGKGFDPEKLPDPTDPANLDRASGRGVMLMRTFMDKVVFNATGNQVTLVKRCRETDEA